VLGCAEDGADGAGLDCSPAAEDDDAVAHLADDGEVVADEEHGDAELVSDAVDEAQDLRLHRHVESGDRLVADEDARLRGERPGERDALTFAAREVARSLALVVRRQADAREQLGQMRSGPAADGEGLAQGVTDRHARVERRVGVLEHDLDRARVARGEPASERCAGEQDLAVEVRVESGDAARDGRLARARLADDADDLRGVHLHVDIVDDGHGAVPCPQAAHGQQGLVVGADRSGIRTGSPRVDRERLGAVVAGGAGPRGDEVERRCLRRAQLGREGAPGCEGASGRSLPRRRDGAGDARQRFERGVDPAFLEEGIGIATALVQELCGGTASEITRAGEAPTEQNVIAYDPGQCASLGGLDVTPDRQKAILEALGFVVDSNWQVTVPTWRRDIHGWQDLVEEVIRIEGLDNIPSTPLPRKPGVAKPTASPEQLAERKARRAAAARGLNEVVNWSFISEKEAAPFGGGTWSLANPISEDMKVMRPSLLPGLLAAAQRNAARGASSIRLFEVGRRYLESSEHPTIGLLLTGENRARSWQTGAATKFDAYDAKAEVIAILAAAGAPTDKLMDFAEAGDHYHPGQSGTLRLGPKKILAAYGVLHPSTTKAMGFKGSAVAAEIFLDAIPLKKKSGHMREAFAPPALQAVTRDFAFIVDADLAADDLVRAVKGADKKLITDARIFDLFEGPSVGEGKKSLAVEVTLQPMDATLTEEDLKSLSDKVVANATTLGAELRGESKQIIAALAAPQLFWVHAKPRRRKELAVVRNSSCLRGFA